MTGRFKAPTEAIKLASAAAAQLRKESKGLATASQQVAAGLNAVGLSAKTKAAPALHLTAEELRRFEQFANQANKTLAGTQQQMGLTASRANQLTRAATRATAAIGFISPTAATAASQIIGITKASGGMILALTAGSVAVIALGSAFIKSAQSAIAFETSFRGIRKTVNATEQEYANLSRANRDLAISLGQNVNTINEIGQAAGQLGIAIGDLGQFEKIVIELASASDIGAKDAAFAFGGLIKVLGLTIDELDSLTDQIVGLGNSFAATESEIVQFLNRIAGAGAVLGITAQDLASIATAFASLRIPAEAGGTAIQKVFLAMQKAAVSGGEELRTFAKAVGLTGDEFRRLVQDNPAKAFALFVSELSRQGAKAQLILEALGLGNERTRRAFLTAAAAGEHLNEVMAQGARDNAEGTARTEEFNKELNTTAGQLRVMKAALNELLITIGDNFLPIITDASGVVVDLTEVIIAMAEAVRTLSAALDVLDLSKLGKIELPGPIPDLELPDLSPKNFVVSSFKMFSGYGAIEDAAKAASDVIDAYSGSEEKAVDAAKAAASAMEAEAEAAKHLTGSVADTAKASNEAYTAAALFQSILPSLSEDINAVGDSADDARKKLFSIFKEPTLEEAQAQLAVLSYRQELNDLETSLIPLTQAEKDRAELLSKQLIPSAERLVEREKLLSDVLAKQFEIELGGLRTRREQAEAALVAAGAVQTLSEKLLEFQAVAQVPSTITIDDDLAQRTITALLKQGRSIAAQEFAFRIGTLGEEEALAAIQALLEAGDYLAAQEFIAHVGVSGVELALKQIEVLLRAGDALAAQQLGFQTGLNIAQIESEQRQREQGRPKFNLPTAKTVFPDVKSLADSAAKAKKEVDPLADGIITLAEALEFGFTSITAATAELGYAVDQLRARFFRVRVETEKLNRAESRKQESVEIALRIAEREVKTRKDLIEAQIKLAVVQNRSNEGMEIALSLAERDLEMRQDLIEMQIEQAVMLGELRAAVGGTWLESSIDAFAQGMIALGEGFRKAEESTMRWLHRLAAATLEATRARFDELFNRPTSEEAGTNLQLAQLRLQRQRLLAGGRTEEEMAALLGPLDLQIAAIEAELALRGAYTDVLKAQAQVADQTLLTDREQLEQAHLLIGVIAEQSALVETLNWYIEAEQVAIMGVVGELGSFANALSAARDVLGGSRYRNSMSTTNNVNVSVHMEANSGDIRAQILREVAGQTDRALRDAGFGGSIVSSGAFVPS